MKKHRIPFIVFKLNLYVDLNDFFFFVHRNAVEN